MTSVITTPAPGSIHKTSIDHARGRLLAAIKSALSVVDRDRTFCTHELCSLRSVVALILNDYGDHYVGASIETPGKVAYSDGAVGPYDNKRRRSTTVGRYLIRQIRADTVLHDKLLTAFSNAVTAAISNPTIEVFDGYDIRDVYESTSADSCMTGTDAYKVELWCQSRVTRLVVCNELGARALLHEAVDGHKYLDRCYPNNSAGAEVLRHWARSRGYFVRKTDGACYDGFVHPTLGFVHDVTIDTGVGVEEIEFWPYVDSVPFLRVDRSGDVVLSSSSAMSECVLNSTGGEGPNSTRCYCCDGIVSNDDVISDDDGDDWCPDCYHESHTDCDCCGGTVHNDHICLVELYVDDSCRDRQHMCDDCTPCSL